MSSIRKAAPFLVGTVALTVLAATLRAFLNHEIGSLALMVALVIRGWRRIGRSLRFAFRF